MKNTSSDKWFASLFENPDEIPDAIAALKGRRRCYGIFGIGFLLLSLISTFFGNTSSTVQFLVFSILGIANYLQIDGWIKLLLLSQAKADA